MRQLRPLAMPDEVAANDAIAAVAAKKAARWKYCSSRDMRELMQQWKADESRYRAAARQSAASRFVQLFEAEKFDGQDNLRIAQLMRDGVGDRRDRDADADGAVGEVQDRRPGRRRVPARSALLHRREHAAGRAGNGKTGRDQRADRTDRRVGPRLPALGNVATFELREASTSSASTRKRATSPASTASGLASIDPQRRGDRLARRAQSQDLDRTCSRLRHRPRRNPGRPSPGSLPFRRKGVA